MEKDTFFATTILLHWSRWANRGLLSVANLVGSVQTLYLEFSGYRTKTSDTIEIHLRDHKLPGALLCCVFMITKMFFVCFSSIVVNAGSLQDMLPISLCFDMSPGAVWLFCRLLGDLGVSCKSFCSPRVSGALCTHGSTLELHYTAIGPITIITALKLQQFVSGMHQCNHQAFGPAEQQAPPFTFYTHSFVSVFHVPCSTFFLLILHLRWLHHHEWRKGAGT